MRPAQTAILTQLPNELLFLLSEFLMAQDILRLAQTSRQFRLIYSSPVIWQRLIREHIDPLYRADTSDPNKYFFSKYVYLCTRTRILNFNIPVNSIVRALFDFTLQRQTKLFKKLLESIPKELLETQNSSLERVLDVCARYNNLDIGEMLLAQTNTPLGSLSIIPNALLIAAEHGHTAFVHLCFKHRVVTQPVINASLDCAALNAHVDTTHVLLNQYHANPLYISARNLLATRSLATRIQSRALHTQHNQARMRRYLRILLLFAQYNPEIFCNTLEWALENRVQNIMSSLGALARRQRSYPHFLTHVLETVNHYIDTDHVSQLIDFFRGMRFSTLTQADQQYYHRALGMSLWEKRETGSRRKPRSHNAKDHIPSSLPTDWLAPSNTAVKRNRRMITQQTSDTWLTRDGTQACSPSIKRSKTVSTFQHPARMTF